MKFGSKKVKIHSYVVFNTKCSFIWYGMVWYAVDITSVYRICSLPCNLSIHVRLHQLLTSARPLHDVTGTSCM